MRAVFKGDKDTFVFEPIPKAKAGRPKKERAVTNADHIRSMTDEELANTIHSISLGWKGQTNWCDFHCENPGDDGCDKCILNWLKQPYKEGGNG